MSRPTPHDRGEPSHRSLGVHLALFAAMAMTLAIMIVIRPVDDRAVHLATVTLLLAALAVSAWFLTRQRRDAAVDGMDSDA